MGNTCYFNSGLQLLFNCEIFTKLILKNDFNNKFISGYKKTLVDYFNINVNCLGPRILFNHLNSNYTHFNNNIQSDTSEFLICLLDLIDNNLKLVNNSLYNDMSNDKLLDLLFNCKIKSEIICSVTNERFLTNNTDIFLSLPIPNKSNISLEDCINEFSKKEQLINDNKYFNEKINKYVNATKQLIITNYPKYLFIILKRFNNIQNKINDDVNINLDYLFSDNNYSLIGIVVHIGNLEMGHYISFIKRDNKWYFCNDNNITECDNIDSIIKKSYILLFNKTNN